MEKEKSFIELVAESAGLRGDLYIPKEFYRKALEKIVSEEEKSERYDSGYPSTKRVYEIASVLYKKKKLNSKPG